MHASHIPSSRCALGMHTRPLSGVRYFELSMHAYLILLPSECMLGHAYFSPLSPQLLSLPASTFSFRYTLEHACLITCLGMHILCLSAISPCHVVCRPITPSLCELEYAYSLLAVRRISVLLLVLERNELVSDRNRWLMVMTVT
jgi:hypothetical protein